jgi:hypothetical protein
MCRHQDENSWIRSRSIAYRSLLSLLACAGAIASAAQARADELPAFAIADFDFKDTSGEVSDQTAEHQTRLKAFSVRLRDGFRDDRKVKLTTLPCEAEQCSARRSGLDTLSAQAKAADAGYLLFGEIHKMSTLVGWVKFAVVDLNKNEPVCDRFLTYRGDTDEAWQRAAKVTVRDVEKYCLP